MTDELDALTLDNELLQMKKLKKLHQLTLAILARKAFLLAALFLLSCCLAAAAFWWMNNHSPKRFQARTNMCYYPKSTEEIKPLDNSQVLHIITRRGGLLSTAQEMGVNEFEMSNFLDSFEFLQDKQTPNYFSIVASASTEEDAIRRVNTFADVIMREYATARMNDLYARRVSTEKRRTEINEEFANLDEEEKALNTEFGVASPLSESERLTDTIADNKKALAENQFLLMEAHLKLKKIQDGFGDANPKILEESDNFRKFSDKLKKCDEEIETLAFSYTSENPKLAVALSEREKVAREYNELLAKYGMKEVHESDFVRIDSLAKQHEATLAEIERINSNITALENGIASDEEKLNLLLKIIPRYEGLKTRRNALKERLNSTEALHSDISYLESTVKNELIQIERVGNAVGTTPFTYKKIIAILFIGGFVTAILALLIIVLDINFGHIYDVDEIDCYLDVESLGTIGESDVEDEDTFDRLISSLGSHRKVFMTSLDKNGYSEEFHRNFMQMCSQTGLNAIMVDIVDAREHAHDPNAKMLVSISYNKEQGWMPVRNPRGLLSMEIAMLKVDLAKLLNKFDLVILKTPDGYCSKLLAAQLSKICESRLILVHPRKTRRNVFKHFLEQNRGIKTMALTVKSFLLAAMLFLVTGCYIYPERLTGNYEQYPLLVDEENVVHKQEVDEKAEEDRMAILKQLEEEPPEMYRINAGDRVKFTVYDHPELSTDATITPDGNLGVIFLGQVKIANLTITEACDLIASGLSKYIKKPMVSITPIEVVSQYCTISGGVAKPGIYPVSSDMRLSELYALAGGSAVHRILGDDLDIADFSTSYIFRNGEPLPVDFKKAITEGDIYHNVRLKKNDRIVIGSRSEEMVCVVGHVKRPSKQLFDKSIGLIEVLTNAGWMEEEYWPNIIIIRGGVSDPKIYRVNIDAILAGKSPNVQLQTGDIVYVPQDDISEFNVFIRKLLPLGQLFNLITMPFRFKD